MTFGLKNSDFQIYEKHKSRSNITMQFKHDSKKHLFKFANMPKFQIINFLLAASIVFKLGYRLQDMKSLSLEAPSVPGRMELAGKTNNGARVYIDFAHTPDALKNVLNTINKIRTQNESLYTIIGCGGNRDREKRPLMGCTAASLSSKVIFTSDNPRDEDPDQIIEEISAGVKPIDYKQTYSITRRRDAIK